jgi:PAS domain S-box-containing protein
VLGTVPGNKAPAARAAGSSPAVTIYTLVLGALILVCAVASLALFGWRRPETWWSLAPLLAMLTAAESLIVRFQYRNQIMAITLFEAVLAPLLVAFPTVVLLCVVLAAEAMTGILRHNVARKAAFNAVQFTIAGGAGSLVYHALGRGGAASGRNVSALAAAMTVVAVVNVVTLSGVIGLAERQPIRAVLRRLAPAILLGWAVNTTFGLLFVAAYGWSPWMTGLFAVPLVGLHWAYRGHASAAADRARLRGLHRATRALAAPVDPRDAIPRFLEEVRACFEAGAADLVLCEGRRRVVHRVRDGSYERVDEDGSRDTLASASMRNAETTRVPGPHAGTAAVALLAAEGWRDFIAAPLFEAAELLGALCVYDLGGPEGFRAGEEAVLQALAGEAARAMIKSTLLATILEERQKLADIVGRTSDGILTLSPAGAIKTWNTALERITGYPATDMVGGGLMAGLRARDADGAPVFLEHWAGADRPLPVDLQITDRGGVTRWLACSYTRVADSDGRPAMLIVVARDATEAREIERLKDDFVATVSHELRTPLTPIKGWAVTLLQLGDHLDEEQRTEGVEAILRHAERLERLITNILEVSKIERGLADRREAPVDVRALSEKVVSDFRSQFPGRTIALDVASGECRTRGDEVWIEQIISNVLSNAMKYSPADAPVEVVVARAGGGIEVSVADRGPGIAEHDAERIFERFKRLGDHMTRSQGGSGLGLYIARQLARAIGGELGVRSAPGGGAMFVLRLRAEEELVPVAS